MITQKSRICSANKETFVDYWGWSIVGDLENVLQATAENAGRIFGAV